MIIKKSWKNLLQFLLLSLCFQKSPRHQKVSIFGKSINCSNWKRLRILFLPPQKMLSINHKIIYHLIRSNMFSFSFFCFLAKFLKQASCFDIRIEADNFPKQSGKSSQCMPFQFLIKIKPMFSRSRCFQSRQLYITYIKY